MGGLLARHLTSTALAAAVLLLSAPVAAAAPPTCGAPPPQTVITGDVLLFAPGSVCSDPDGDVLTYAVTTAPAHGTLEFDSGAFVYRPAAPYTGADAFSFTASDGTDTTAPVTVDVTVEPNQPPQCPPSITLEVEPDVPTSFDPWFECSDDQFFFLFDIVVPPEHGTLTPYDFDAGFTYEPDPGYRGPDSLTIRANDGVSQSDPIVVEITVLQPNHAPHCVTPLTVRVAPGGSATLDHRVSCTDADGDPMSPELVTGPSHGTLEVNLPTVVYRAAAGYRGLDLVRYRVHDDRGGVSNVAVVNLIVGTVIVPGPPPDRTAPELTLTKAGTLKLGSVRKKGLRLRVSCDEPGTMRIEASVTRATARKLRIKPKAKGPVIVGRATKAVTAGDNELTVKLTRKARKRLARARSVKLRLVVRVADAAGNVGTDTLRVTLRR